MSVDYVARLKDSVVQLQDAYEHHHNRLDEEYPGLAILVQDRNGRGILLDALTELVSAYRTLVELEQSTKHNS